VLQGRRSAVHRDPAAVPQRPAVDTDNGPQPGMVSDVETCGIDGQSRVPGTEQYRDCVVQPMRAATVQPSRHRQVTGDHVDVHGE
jgi:hypothetical protein